VIIRKRVPWSGDATETAVTASNNPGCGSLHGDDIPAVSPDGQWVVFSRCNGSPTGGWSLWKVPITGGTAIQLTPTVGRTDFYASWSPDGQAIYFQRIDAAIGPQWTLWKVPAAGGTAEQVFIPPASPISDAVQPALSPDGKILLMGYGKRDDLEAVSQTGS
jgi:dipeptidyl aminopeptidase/acylaminoacyl peptidase